jgi:predicted HicB family RNase H-like nuclease
VKRGYSRDFTPRTERRVTLTIDKIPPTLLSAAKAKAKREGISLRALILGWLKEWAAPEER